MSTRTHYSREPITELRDIGMPMAHVDHKPLGFWYAIGDAWRVWCVENDCDHWINGTRFYRIALDTARVLKLRTAEDIRHFAREWSFQGDSSRIVWPCVAMFYDGIEITPYQWACRHDDRTRFYYSWDVASGVLWNASKARLLSPPPPLPEGAMKDKE